MALPDPAVTLTVNGSDGITEGRVEGGGLGRGGLYCVSTKEGEETQTETTPATKSLTLYRSLYPNVEAQLHHHAQFHGALARDLFIEHANGRFCVDDQPRKLLRDVRAAR